LTIPARARDARRWFPRKESESTVHKRATSACAVLAWCILLTLAAAVMTTAARPAQASPRIASNSITQVTGTTMVTAPKPATALPATVTPEAVTPRPAARHVVQPGDTLSGIAAASAVAGGWPALYAANRGAIGPDPNVIHPGTVLVLPGRAGRQDRPARYRIRAGDTLSGIAAALGVHGGWAALYAANRRAIGPDPSLIHPGVILTAPRPASARPAPPASPAPLPARAIPPGTAPHHPRPAPPATPATAQPGPAQSGQARPTPQAQPVNPAAGMPRWLAAIMLAAALLIAAAFITEPAMAIWRRRQRRRDGPAALDAQRIAAAKARIVLAGNDKLIVTYSRADDTVYVLTPPGEDPRTVLRAARLVLPDDNYEQLAGHLGVPANWPLE
jgi:LysM repeat protein